MPDAAALRAANIDPVTGLATDYLNHFNEVAMLVGMVADMPELMDELRAWRPLAYVEHFERSSLAGRALAIMAYHAADPARRAPFERVIARLDGEVAATVAALDAAASPPALRETAERAAGRIAALIALADAIIHGTEPEGAGRDASPGSDPAVGAQHCVDALFA